MSHLLLVESQNQPQCTQATQNASTNAETSEVVGVVQRLENEPQPQVPCVSFGQKVKPLLVLIDLLP